MRKNKKLDKSLGNFSRQKQATEETFFGELGVPLGGSKIVDVSGRRGYVYVRLRGDTSELIQAYNQVVPSIYNLAVVVKRNRNKYSIIGRDDTKYSNTGSGAGGGVTPLPRHGGQHSLNPDAGMGADVSWIYTRQFMPNLAYPSGTSTQLTIHPHFYEWNGQFKYINPTGSVNLASYIPTATGSAVMALVWVEGDTGALRVSAGAGFSGGVNNNWDIAGHIPDIDRNTGLPLMAVKLTTGTTSLDWSNLYDVRDFQTVSKRFDGIGIQDSTTPAGTGTTLNFGSNLSVSMAGNVATINGGISVPIVTGVAASNYTAAVNKSYMLDISGLTANRNFVLPGGAVGDTIEVVITAGDDTYELIIIGDTGITINGGSAATEWSRIFLPNERVKLVMSTTTNWVVVEDGRRPCVAVFHRTSSGTGGSQAAGDTVLPDWNTLYIDKGWCGDLTNDYFKCRRAGYYSVSGGAAFSSITDQKYANIQIWKNGALTTGSVSSGTKIANSSARQSTVTNSSVIGTVIGGIPADCAAGDYLVYFYETEEASKALFQTDFAGGGADVLAYSTQFTIQEILP